MEMVVVVEKTENLFKSSLAEPGHSCESVKERTGGIKDGREEVTG